MNNLKMGKYAFSEWTRSCDCVQMTTSKNCFTVGGDCMMNNND